MLDDNDKINFNENKNLENNNISKVYIWLIMTFSFKFCSQFFCDIKINLYQKLINICFILLYIYFKYYVNITCNTNKTKLDIEQQYFHERILYSCF